jgi:hypothetical protein
VFILLIIAENSFDHAVPLTPVTTAVPLPTAAWAAFPLLL